MIATRRAPPTAQRLAAGDQRTMGRASYARRAGNSIGGVSLQDDETEAMLRYLAEVGRLGDDATPRARGFAHVRRAR